MNIRKYPMLDENYFEQIDTEAKAYFLGLLYADGYNNEEKGIITLSINKEDIDILEKLKSYIQPTKPIYIIKAKKPEHSDIANLTFTSKKLSKDLANNGCVQRKTFKILFPNIKEELKRHFIRGYLDGDGYISKDIKYPETTLIANKDFCLYLKEYLKKQLNINCSLGNISKDLILVIRIGGRKQVVKFLEYLYNNSTIYLYRKYNKWLNIKEYDNTIKLSRLCKICNEKMYAKNYCRYHYYQEKNKK